MTMTRVEIEEIGPGRWVAEVEAGGTAAVRRGVRAQSFDDIILAVVEAHAELTGAPAPKREGMGDPRRRPVEQHSVDGDKSLPADYGTPHDSRLATTSQRAAAESAALAAEVGALPALNELREKAEALGIDVDGRWGAARLQAEIDQATETRKSGGGDAA